MSIGKTSPLNTGGGNSSTQQSSGGGLGIRVGRPGVPQRRTPMTHNPGAVTAGAQGVAVPVKSTGAQLTQPRFGRNLGRPTVPLSVASVAASTGPHGAVQRQTFVQPVKPQRFG